MRRSFATTLALAAAFTFAAPVSAQQSDSRDSSGWEERADRDRATIMDFLARPDVGDAAADLRIDMQDLGERVLEMGAHDAALVAERVRDAEQQAAADTITITTTTLIIGLLVLIVLILVL